MGRHATRAAAGPGARARPPCVIALAVLLVALVRKPSNVPGDWRSMVPLVLVVVVYVGYLVASASIVAFGAINTRFLVPVFVPVVILGAWTLRARVRERIARTAIRTAMTAIAIAWVVVNVGVVRRSSDRICAERRGRLRDQNGGTTPR